MCRTFFAVLTAATFFLTCCNKKESNSNANPGTALLGTWVRVDDPPGRQPADTLHFLRRNGKDLLAFYCAGSPGPNWPSQAETEFKFDNGKLIFKDYSGTTSDFYTVESFQWVTIDKQFSVKLREILLYMSADYRVTYQKIP
ncbi:MAG TPA: hypothetical protein VM935_10500 [Chitinophagaceae bacterium]|nr:hypothetical protein [Chitinophagaceae bacterium]